jgi:fimbrial isopeptide formation D2 family protein/LPXTG-motif cell wall-anchored protein
MNHHERGRFVRRALALVGTAALALGGVAAAGSAASADDSDPPTSAQLGNINFDTPRTLTVHKFEEVGNEDPFSPTGSDAPAGGLNGVEFTVQKVLGLDLTDPASWTIAQNLEFVPVGPGNPTAHATDGTNDYQLAAASAPQETVNGITTFTGLDFAVYLVMEGDDNGDNGITNKAAPFFVTLPLPDNGNWIYAVHVFPKNSLSSATKTVAAPETPGLGSFVSWTIRVKVPFLSPGVDFTDFVVTDDLDERLQYDSYTMTLGGSPVVGATVDEPSLAAPGGTFSATLVGDGVNLNTLLKANQGETLEIVLKTRVVALAPSGDGDNGVVPNSALININGYEYDTAPVYTYWGDLWVQKTDNFQNVLEGAVFQIFECAPAINGQPNQTQGSPISVLVGDDPTDPADWSDEFRSDSTGKVFVNGLWVSNGVSTDTRDYCLQETTAPAGYDLMDPNPKRVTVKVGSSTAADITVVNPQKPPVDLPLTGSTGTIAFMAGGLALLLVAAGAALLSSRKRARESAEL